jgi:hypothetical protein
MQPSYSYSNFEPDSRPLSGLRAKPASGWLLLILALVVLGPATVTLGQPPIPPNPWLVTPDVAWGGHLVPEQVPFQPNLERADLEDTAIPMVFQPSFPATPAPPGWMPLAAEGLSESGCDVPENEPPLPPGARDGLFQKIFFTGTWLPQLDGESFGWGDLESGIVLGFPFFRRDTPLFITPRVAVHLLEKPDTVDLPGQVYDTSFEFRHLRQFGESPWGMDVAVRLGYYSDFERSSSDAFRVTGYGLGAYESSPGTKWVLGAAYLNRANATILPIGGVLIEHSSNVRWELIVPRPRVAWKLAGSVADCDERWLYLAGEFGGGGWSIVRPDTQVLDRLFYSDYRLLIGYERKIIGGLSRLYELGYVFNRKLEFGSPMLQASLDDTLFLRVGLTY